eukprot:CAMPEP_0182419708 /NCGR_PEP_ID=MMETSP1167-20130531/4099_1 /TAXON_ID=2988 /ORGANISM="Mallomonas Sp, Strain CCMP3275" /LENGTH=410 /DNA_ID=CAMNT_0024594771 /DNA_START=123 /DNA_END=1355 /DNA_ORIENTATION=-
MRHINPDSGRINSDKWAKDKYESEFNTDNYTRDNNSYESPRHSAYGNGGNASNMNFNRPDNQRKRYRDDEPNFDSGISTTRPKVMSKIVAISGTHISDVDKNINDNGELEKTTSQEVYSKPEAVSRNRRMFGALMGHLDRAKRTIEKDDVIDKQSKLTALAAEKNLLEAKRQAHQQKMKIIEEKDKSLDLRDQEHAQLRKKRLIQASEVSKIQMELQSNFLATSTTPEDTKYILWLPAQHNQTTTDMLVLRKLEVDVWLKERELKDSKALEAIDEGVKTISDERRMNREKLSFGREREREVERERGVERERERGVERYEDDDFRQRIKRERGRERERERETYEEGERERERETERERESDKDMESVGEKEEEEVSEREEVREREEENDVDERERDREDETRSEDERVEEE